MTNEQLDLLRKGRFVELSDNETYAISTENDFETFDLIAIDWVSPSSFFDKNSFDDDFKCRLISNYTQKRIKMLDINKIATDYNFKNIIWERKEQ